MSADEQQVSPLRRSRSARSTPVEMTVDERKVAQQVVTLPSVEMRRFALLDWPTPSTGSGQALPFGRTGHPAVASIVVVFANAGRQQVSPLGRSRVARSTPVEMTALDERKMAEQGSTFTAGGVDGGASRV